MLWFPPSVVFVFVLCDLRSSLYVLALLICLIFLPNISICFRFFFYSSLPFSGSLSIVWPLFSCFILFSTSHFSSLSSSLPVALGRNQPLKRERPKWKSDYPMTEGQLRSKRDEFWDTAPAFEGRKEIWDALRAAASAFESNDHLLAQAILDGASITLPHGNTHFHLRSGRCSKQFIVFVFLSSCWGFM